MKEMISIAELLNIVKLIRGNKVVLLYNRNMCRKGSNTTKNQLDCKDQL